MRWGVLSTAAINGSLVPGLLDAAGTELAGFASRAPERAEAAALRWGGRAYPSYEALLDDPGVDAVYIPLPNHMHAEWTVRALEAGKHVLCEKPLALSVADVDVVARACERTGRSVLEAFMYRHTPRWQRAVSLVRQGALGDPRLVKVVFAFAVPTDPANIRFVTEAGGGIIWDMGCYAANMARGLFGAEPTEVSCLGDVRHGQPTETTATGVMRFGEGRNAAFAVSFDFPNPWAQVEVLGTEGWIALPGTGFRREPVTKLVMHTGGELYTDGREPTTEIFAFVDPYQLEVEHLNGVVRGEHPPAFGLDDARANTAVLEATHRSLQLRAPSAVER